MTVEEQRDALLVELREAFIVLGVTGNNTEAARIYMRAAEIIGRDPAWMKFNAPILPELGK